MDIMKGFGTLFKSSKGESRSRSSLDDNLKLKTRNNDTTDDKSREYFRTQDLSRNNFTYAILSSICWWPDEILLFVEILSLAYNEFINIYRSDSTSFDEAIRTAIYFMNQKPYSNEPQISRFIHHGDFKIVDNYLSTVIAEDNCYMRELEDRKRSSNEHKHYLLARALETLLTLTPIKDGDNVFKNNHEESVRMYATIYNLKNMYAMLDDTLRAVLSASLGNVNTGINLSTTFGDLLEEFDSKILANIHEHYEGQLFTKALTFRDLLLYGYHSTCQFSHVFGSQHSTKDNKTLFYQPSIDAKTVERIQYVYKYYLSQIRVRETKTAIVSATDKFEDMVSKIYDTHIMFFVSPRYVQNQEDMKEGDSGAVFVTEFSAVVNKKEKRKI
jgi:hypothetical protein